ncbi:MAG: gliding motility-associated C-terminal domain-containing protein [Chitinophagia bacterium]|jgi:gliding motility-associated-like protein
MDAIMSRKKWIGLIFLKMLLFSGWANAQNYIFAQLNGAPINTNGWNLQGSAAIGNIKFNNNSELIVCPARNSTSGAVFYNQPINLSICNKWKAAFEFRMFDGSGADGIAFCFLEVPPVGFVSGAGLGIPANANGLKICFDTYNNCITPSNASVPKVEIRWGVGYNECWSQPTLENTSGAISYIRSTDYNQALIEYDNGNITVSVNGNVLLTGNQTFTFTGYLGFTASTGGSTDNHSIRNVVIYTDMPPSYAGGVNGLAGGCPNQVIQLGTTPNAAYQYSWLPATGISNAAISNPSLQLINNTDTIQTIQYKVQTAFKTNPGCYSSDSVTIQVKPNPIIQFKRPAICLLDALATFTDSSYSRDPASLPFTYQWNFGDPAATLGNPNQSNLQNPTHSYSAASVYQVSSKVTSASGCSDSLILPFTVNGAIPKADLQITSSRNFCNNEPITIIDKSTVNFGNTTRINIYWDEQLDPTGVETDIQPAFNKKYPHFYPYFNDTAGRNVTLRYEVYSGISCKNTIIRTFSLVAYPKVVFSELPDLCSNSLPYQIIEAGEITGIRGTGIFSGSGVQSFGLFTPFTATKIPVQYLYETYKGCKDSATQIITVHGAPSVNAGSDLRVAEGRTIRIPAQVNGNGSRVQWIPAIYLNNDTILNPDCTPLKDITYLLVATDSNSCSAVDTLNIKVLLKPIAPNAFSPNGDGINDTWQILYLNDFPNCRVEIFTRAGLLIFQSNGYGTPWDGNYKGNPLPIGTYYYIIQPGNGIETVKGSVTLLR